MVFHLLLLSHCSESGSAFFVVKWIHMTFSHHIPDFLAPSTNNQQQLKLRLLKKSGNYVAYAHKRPEAVDLSVFFCIFLICFLFLIYILEF